MAWPTSGVIVKHPVIPFTKTNRTVFRNGNGHYKAVQKAASMWKHEYCTINFLVRSDVMSDAVDFLRTYKSQSVSFSISGVQMFIRADEMNNVYIFTFTKVSREKQFYSKFSVTFLRVPA